MPLRPSPTPSAELPASFLNFDRLPSAALVEQRTLELLFSCGATTIWRRVKDGGLPQPYRHGRCTRWKVGDLREVLDSKGGEE